ncbi:thioredoxin family protein [bacterium]|nr:thioredoxin family protein [bacterium]
MTTKNTENHKVVSRDEWIRARKELLAKEKNLTHERDSLSEERRNLPWEKVEKNYTFDTPNGKVTLSELFEDKNQLVVYHFMFAPGWEQGCPSCSMIADTFDGMRVHLAARDVSFVVVSRATPSEIETFKKRMGWSFKWLSSFGTDFNYDYRVSFTKEEMETGKVQYNYTLQEFTEEGPGLSVFYKDANGNIFHTYSTYGRGLDTLLHPYNFLDLVPKGRDEDGLAFDMAWVRHHDRYGEGYRVDPKATYSISPKDLR